MSMALDGISIADRDIEAVFLTEIGADPYEPTPERQAQVRAVAERIADFLRRARSSLDIAIYDFKLHDEAAEIVIGALRDCAGRGVVARIAYDATATGGMSPASPVAFGADSHPGGTEDFLRALAGVASLKSIRGERVLMHNKYIVRDARTPEAAVLTGSANFTNDSWGLQDNNIVTVASPDLAAYYAADFAELWSRGRITEATGRHDAGTVRVRNVPLAVAFTPGESITTLKEIVGAIAAARRRLLVASVVLSSGPILAALSEAMDRGLALTGLYDGPQMDQVGRQWAANRVGPDKLRAWEKVSRALQPKPSLPYEASEPHRPHNFMHNKVLVADDAVLTGSFNFSNHAMGNAENTLLVRSPEFADAYEAYVRGLVTKYASARSA